jgi:FkbM family methyltransferase
MKFPTLRNLNIRAMARYYKKRLKHQIQYRSAQLRGIHSYPVTVNGVSIDLYFAAPYHHARAQDFSEGNWEELKLLPIWIDESKKASLISDVGGYNGIYGLFAAKANPHAKVLIFEPDPINVAHIRRNAEKNKVTCTVIEAAVSDKEGRARFSGEGATGGRIIGWGKLEVPTVLLVSYGSPELLKIDIEGHEPEALRGADLSKTRTMFIEMNNDKPIADFHEIARENITAVLKRN